jgi:glyoxylase-like metal-dependent hydrolase (beta-lactamase superfamily II)
MGNLKRFLGGNVVSVTNDLACLQNMIVNIYMYGKENAGDRNWVLIDTGLPSAASAIRKAAAGRFGKGARASAIILTHAHFDHITAADELSKEWNIPVYAHPIEIPYAAGEKSYAPRNFGAGGGIMPLLSFMFPRKPGNVKQNLRELPPDGSVPGMPGWKWIHTPGHCEGHISLYRDLDRLLIAGDAFVTLKEESFIAAVTQKKKVHRPPGYFTSDWQKACDSVKKLAALRPDIAVTGHGLPMRGAELRGQLNELAQTFSERVPGNRKEQVKNC